MAETEPLEKKMKPKWRELTDTVLMAMSLAFFARVAVAEPRYIPSESMLPTLQVQDRLIVEKISHRAQGYHRGDILVFFPPEREDDTEASLWQDSLKWLGLSTDKAYIKRVIGLPGDRLEVKDGKVWINGQALDEAHYIKEPPMYFLAERTIPMGHVFVMGDNRNDSYDSHIWGVLPQSNVIGKARFLFWPLERMGAID